MALTAAAIAPKRKEDSFLLKSIGFPPPPPFLLGKRILRHSEAPVANEGGSNRHCKYGKWRGGESHKKKGEGWLEAKKDEPNSEGLDASLPRKEV